MSSSLKNEYHREPYREATTMAVEVSEPKTTITLNASVDEQGRRMVNEYIRLQAIGQGSHGKVWLCIGPYDEKYLPHVEGADGRAEFSYYAIKSVAREERNLRRSLRRRQDSPVDCAGDDSTVRRGVQLAKQTTARREVAIMKRLNHPNIVRLREVIDDPKSKKLFMVLEFMAGGQIVWQDDVKQPTMNLNQAKHTFRDVVLGLEYLHHQGIIHRDIKPANLLWTENRERVKITDFGVSHVMIFDSEDDDALRKTAGSPAFFAPELCYSSDRPTVTFEGGDGPADKFIGRGDIHSFGYAEDSYTDYISLPIDHNSDQTAMLSADKRIDIWALGVTLYCLLFGDTPFMANTEYELYNVICSKPIFVPEYMCLDRVWTGSGNPADHRNESYEEGRCVVDLLGRLLKKDPKERIDLNEIKAHRWLQIGGEGLVPTLTRSDTVVITEADVAEVTKARHRPPGRSTIRQALRGALDRFPKLWSRFSTMSLPKNKNVSMLDHSTDPSTPMSRLVITDSPATPRTPKVSRRHTLSRPWSSKSASTNNTPVVEPVDISSLIRSQSTRVSTRNPPRPVNLARPVVSGAGFGLGFHTFTATTESTSAARSDSYLSSRPLAMSQIGNGRPSGGTQLSVRTDRPVSFDKNMFRKTQLLSDVKMHQSGELMSTFDTDFETLDDDAESSNDEDELAEQPVWQSSFNPPSICSPPSNTHTHNINQKKQRFYDEDEASGDEFVEFNVSRK